MSSEAALYLTTNHLISRWAAQGACGRLVGKDMDEAAGWILKGIKDDFKNISSSLPKGMITKREIKEAIQSLRRYGLIDVETELQRRDGITVTISMSLPENQRQLGTNLVRWFVDTYVKNTQVPNALIKVFNDITIGNIHDPWYDPYLFIHAHLLP
jgi:hypothetical protein